MAIALETALNVDTNSVLVATYSVTVTGTDTILVVGVMTGTRITSINSVTYNGVAMTQINTQNTGGSVFAIQSLFYLINPTQGANDVVISCSGSAHYIYSSCGVYSGVDQTTPFEPTAGVTSVITGTSVSASITTANDNDWLVGFFGILSANTGQITAGANTVIEAVVNNWDSWIDTGSAQTPAGLKTITINGTTSELMGINAIALIPAPVITQNAPFFGCAF